MSPLGTVAIYQRLVVAGGGFFLLLDLGPGAAACGMGIEINTGYSRGGGGFSDLHCTGGVEKESGFYPERGRLWSLRTSLQIHEHPQFVHIVQIG